MRALVVHNPSAGARQHRSPLSEALAALTAQGWELDVRETVTQGDATRFARQAAEAAYEVAFAVGGDGTLNEVLNGVLASETRVGILPLGTANVWALEMGLPLGDLKRAALLQASAPARAIDVGMVEGKGFGPRAFILSCGAGFDAAVINEVEHERTLKRRWGKLWFILVGVRRALAYRGRRVRVTVDGVIYRRRVLLALTSNAQLYGAAIRLPPDARIDDGLLDVTLLEGANALHTAWHFIRLGAGIYRQQPDVEHMTGREIEIQGARLPIHADAEPLGWTPLRISIRHRALRVLVPETANRSLFSTIQDRGPDRATAVANRPYETAAPASSVPGPSPFNYYYG